MYVFAQTGTYIHPYAGVCAIVEHVRVHGLGHSMKAVMTQCHTDAVECKCTFDYNLDVRFSKFSLPTLSSEMPPWSRNFR